VCPVSTLRASIGARAVGYDIYKHRNSTVRLYDHWLYSLVGKGEHEGTILTLPQEQIFKHRFASEADMANFLDRAFLLAHHDRLSASCDTHPTGQDAKQGLAGTASGAVAKPDAQKEP
jgi:hypothetical protein